MFRKIALISVYILSIFLIISCSKNKITYIDKLDYWDSYQFQDTKLSFISNAKVIDSLLYCTTNDAIINFRDIESPYYLNYLSDLSTGLDYKPLISNDFTIYLNKYNNNTIIIQPTKAMEQMGRYVNFDNLDSTFTNTSIVHKLNNREFGVFGNNRFITLIRGLKNNKLLDCLGYIDIKSTESNIEIIDTGFYYFTDNNPNIYKNISLKGIFFYNNQFHICYYSNNDAYYRIINMDHTYTETKLQLATTFYSFFDFDEQLWGLTADYNIMNSIDGHNWQQITHFEPYIYDFKQIDNKLFFYLNDKVYFMEPSRGFSYYQLPSENLKGKYITSINKLKDKLIITTTSGIYYKSLNEVLRDKIRIK